MTAANFGQAVITKPALEFGGDDVIALAEACAIWPEGSRALFVTPACHAALLRDRGFQAAWSTTSDAALSDGRPFPRVFGFDYCVLPTLPHNSEKLVGFACHKSALVCGFAPVPPIQEVREAGADYDLAVDAKTGVALEYRSYGSNVMDTGFNVVECSFGWQIGNAGALKRIVSP